MLLGQGWRCLWQDVGAEVTVLEETKDEARLHPGLAILWQERSETISGRRGSTRRPQAEYKTLPTYEAMVCNNGLSMGMRPHHCLAIPASRADRPDCMALANGNRLYLDRRPPLLH